MTITQEHATGLSDPAKRERLLLDLLDADMFTAMAGVDLVLAGDIYGRTPIWGSLRIFKLIYYTSSLVQLPTALRAWRRRQTNLRPVDEAAGAR